MTLRNVLAASAATTALLLAATPGSADSAHDDHVASLDQASISGHSIAYLDIGNPDDPAVLLLHGIPTNSFLFHQVAPAIAEAGYRVIAPDMLGFGASDRPDDAAAYATDARANRMFALADHLGVEGFTLVLHDVGGITGWKMIETGPDRLEAVVATNTLAGLAGVEPAPLVMQMMGGQLSPVDAFAGLDDPAIARDMAQMWLDQGYWGEGTAPTDIVDAFGADLVGAQVSYTTFFGMAVPAFMQEEEARNAALAGFEGPTAVIFGERDGFFDHTVVVPDLQTRLGTEDANVVRIPDAGHFLQLQEPDAYVDALTAFLGSAIAN